MESAVLCLALLPACSSFEPSTSPRRAARWHCISSAGCERARGVAMIDRAPEIDTR